MHVTSWHFWFTYTGLAYLLVVALPFSLLAMCALAFRRRSRGVPSAWAWRSALADVGMVHGTVPWVAMTLLPGSRAGAVPGRVSLVPLEDLLVMGAPGIIGNLLIFAAFGFFAPIRFAGLASILRILALAGSCSLLIEVAQYVFELDRVSSVDDVLLNAAGAGLAALASHPWWRTTAGETSDAAGLDGLPARELEHLRGPSVNETDDERRLSLRDAEPFDGRLWSTKPPRGPGPPERSGRPAP